MPRWKHLAWRLRSDGEAPRGSVVFNILRRAQWAGHGVDLSWWIRRTETEVAAADGPPGEDRLLWSDRAAGGLWDRRRVDYHGEARWRRLDTQRPKEMDRQRSVV